MFFKVTLWPSFQCIIFYSGCWGFLLLPPKRRRWAGIRADPSRAPQHLEGRHRALTCPPPGHRVRPGRAGGHEGGTSPPDLEEPFWRLCRGGTVPDPCCAGPGPWPKQKGSDQSASQEFVKHLGV